MIFERPSRVHPLQRAWESLDTPALGRRVPGTLIVATVALLFGFAASFWSISSGSHFAYADAQSHLTIARRMFDSQAPGFTQLGTVWLPLPNLLLIPFSLSLWFWSTGWGAAMLGILCLMVSVSAGYRIAVRIGLHRAARLTFVGLIIVNPSFMYAHTTALSEPVLIACLMATVAGLAAWARSPRELSAGEVMVFSSAPAAAAVLSRYEGWALVLTGSLFITIVCWRRRRSVLQVLKLTGAFVLWPLLAMLWWLSYNFVVYGNALEFMNGPYSASALQERFMEAGLITYSGSIGLSVWVYHWAIIGTAGIITLIFAGIGLITICARFGLTDRALIVWLLATGWGFSLVSLFLGQTHLYNMEALPANWLNNRYALVSLPWLAMLCAVLIDSCLIPARRMRANNGVIPTNNKEAHRASHRFPAIMSVVAASVVTVLLLGQTVWMYGDVMGRSAVLAEAAGYLKTKRDDGTNAAAAFLGEHYDGGGILMDEAASGNAILPQIGIPIANYFNRSSGDRFTEALADPAANTRWIIYTVEKAPVLSSLGNADFVYQRLLDNPAVLSQYEPVFQEGNYRILRRIGDA